MYNYTLLTELYKRERKFQKVYTTFRPNLKGLFCSVFWVEILRLSTSVRLVFSVSPVTGKFYARHEANVNQGDPNDQYIRLLEQAKSLGPKNKFSSPKTESQR